jgi:hypothetical protein
MRYKKIVPIDIALRPAEGPHIDKLVMVMKVMFFLFLHGARDWRRQRGRDLTAITSKASAKPTCTKTYRSLVQNH